MYVDDYLREDSDSERPRRLRQGMLPSFRRKKESRCFPEAVGGSKVIIEYKTVENGNAKMLKVDKKSYPADVKNVEKLLERRIMTRLLYVRIVPIFAVDAENIICHCQ